MKVRLIRVTSRQSLAATLAILLATPIQLKADQGSIAQPTARGRFRTPAMIR
jgi:hypothetical protein